MRKAEFIMAGIMAVFSLYLMWMSAKLPIGWVAGSGPGGGAFPFWLSLGMLLCSVWTLVRTFRRVTPESRSTAPYMDRHAFQLFLIAAVSLTAMVALIHIVGVYGAIPLFFIFYVRYFGRHSWATTIALAVATPVVTFFFFEVGLKILLPKGYIEPLFIPLYRIFLGT